jgi:hypothetical protein
MNDQAIFVIVIIVLLVIIYKLPKPKKSFKSKYKKQIDFVKNYQFPSRVEQAVLDKYPHLKQSDISLVIKAFKDYFIIAIFAEGKMVAMPSQVVDVAWHEFLLFTKEYQEFCNNAFGRFFHHYPFANNKSGYTKAQNSLIRAWQLACEYEDINPNKPDKLPFLFNIDNLLNIPDGIKYNDKNKSFSHQTSNSNTLGCGGGDVSGYNEIFYDIGNFTHPSTTHSSDIVSSIDSNSSNCGGSSCGGSSCGGGCGGGS